MDRPSDSGPRAAPSNPLLSTAVTGLRLQDLTHHAVLLPVLAPTDSQNNRPQNTPLRATGPTASNRFNDGNANKPPPPALHLHSKPPTAPADIHKYGSPGETKTESKASAKPDDDFDVNEYFARLQGTRYVSAPLSGHIKEDANANLEETEDNLEEINLLEESTVSAEDAQQSLTADIAQNFSQLPQVLPQVASAVFSSFSSILNLNRSREETPVPDVPYGQGGYGSYAGHGMQGQVRQNLEGYTPTSSAVPMFSADSMGGIGKPLGGCDERAPAVVGPPPIGGAPNTFRMTNRKKTYAHIPGLSTGEVHSAPQAAALEANHPPKLSSSQETIAAPQYYAPSTSLNMFDPNVPPSSTDPFVDISVATKDAKSERITSSSAVMTEILETQLADVLPSMAYSHVLNGNSLQKYSSEDRGQDVSDFSGSFGEVSKNKEASFEEQSIQANANLDLFVPSVPMGTLDPLQSSFIENKSMSVPWQTKSENFELNTNTPSSRLPQTIISTASDMVTPSVSMLLTPSNLSPSGSLPQNKSPSIDSPSQTQTAPLTENVLSREQIPQRGVVPPVDNLSRTDAVPPIGVLPQAGILNPLEHFQSTGMMPSTKPLMPTGMVPPSEMIPLTGMVPSSGMVQSSVMSSSTAIAPPKGIAPLAGRLPPTGKLPPNANISYRNASGDRAVMPPSLARKLSSKQSGSTTTDLIGPGLNMFVPLASNDNIQSTDSSEFRYSSASEPQTLTPSENIVPPREKNPSDFCNPATVPEMPPAEHILGNKTDSRIIPNAPENIVPTPPIFFNPQAFEQNVSSNSSQILGYMTDNSVKQLSEETALRPPSILPPKSVPSGQNFRIGNKKKLQYYSGPIDTIGHGNNTEKAILAPITPVAGHVPDNVSLFTPAVETNPTTQELDKQLNVDTNQGLLYTPYDIGQHQQQQAFETAFDLSRPPHQQDSYNPIEPFGYSTAEPYIGGSAYQQDTQREESKPAAILGSLKSKLSSVNINKLQSAVTSFFDPAYYEPEKKETLIDNNTTNFSYGTQPSNVINFNYGPIHGPDSHLEISVPFFDINNPTAQQYPTPYAQNYGTPFNNPSTFELNARQYNHFQNYPPQPFNEGITTYALTPDVSKNESLHTDGKIENLTCDLNQTDLSSENILSYFSDKQQDTPGLSNLGSQTICTDHTNSKNNKSSLTEVKNQTSVATYIIQDSKFGHSNQSNYSGDCDKNEFESIESNISKIKSVPFAQNSPADFFGPEYNSPLASICPIEKEIEPIDGTPAASVTTERRCSHYKNDKNNDQETGTITTQLIENMTAPIQLFNPVAVPFTESSVEVNENNRNIDSEQFDEISQITEETIKSIEIQSSIELLDNENEIDNVNNQESNMFFDEAYGSYGWSIKSEPGPIQDIEHLLEPECSSSDNNTNIGFKDDSFNIPRNASDEIKAELKQVSQEDVLPLVDKIAYNYFPRQMSIPTAPPIEYFSDVEFNTGQRGIDIRAGILDVNLIEQDAKSDYPELDPYIIEPSETDDDKLESYKEKDNSEELQIHPEDENVHSILNEGKIDSLTESSETNDYGYKTSVASSLTPKDLQKLTSPPVTFASYFDTGNYAADNYFRNVKNTIEPIPLGQSNPVGNIEIIHNLESGSVRSDQFEGPMEKQTEIYKEPNDKERNSNVLQSFTNSQQNSFPEPLYDFENLGKSSYESKNQSNQETSDGGNKILNKSTFEIPAETIGSVCLRKSISPAKDMIQTTDPLQSFCTNSSQDINDAQEMEHPEPSFNLLASYFVTPTGATKSHKPDPQKSFFELSEGQDHYMHQMQAHNVNQFYPSCIKPASSEQLIMKTEFPPTPVNINECEKHKASQTFFEQCRRDNGHIIGNTSNEFLNKIGEITPLSSQCTILDSKFVVNIPNVQPNFINNNCISTDVKNVFSNEMNVNNNNEIANSKVVCSNNLSEISSNKAEYDATNIKASNKNIYDKPKLKDEIGFSMESNIGGEIEELFTDFETKLAGIVNNCDRCCVRQCFDGEITDIESGVCNLDFHSLDDTRGVCVGEVMDADGNEKGKRVSGLSLRTKAETNSRGAGTSVSFKDARNEDYQDNSQLEKNNAEPGQYQRVRPHWFYRLDREGKSLWRPFSAVDSDALEAAYSDPALSEGTLVATDGGRFDVNILGRIRCPVYWDDKPTNVRRCSWFYKGTTDARYVPYTEAVADLLEDEYRRGCETGEWHRRIALPGGESVVLHSADVMVHFLQGSSPEAWGNTSELLFGKKIYRGLPKNITPVVSERKQVDHLLFLVHGAGYHKNALVPAVVRPRVVRRGVDADEVEEGERSPVDHLLLLCHGIGSACDLRFRPVEEVVDDFRATSSQLIQSHYRDSCESGRVGRVEVLPVSWHRALHAGEGGVDARLAAITLESIPRLRGFTNDTVLDVLFYTSPVYCQRIINTVGQELNRIHALFMARNPGFGGGVSLGGHSLGSLILFDLLRGQAAGAGLPEEGITYPQLRFAPRALFALGSPIAIFQCIRGVDSLGVDFALPTCPNFFNIFHPYDPVAYRVEPLIEPRLKGEPPLLIPHHKGRKRMHLELKETMARVGADLRARLVGSLRSTWASVWRAPPAPPAASTAEQPPLEAYQQQLDKVEEEYEGSSTSETVSESATDARFGRLNGGRRVDHVLQEAPFEIFNEYLFALTSHVCYWESEDTMLLILREIYGGLGVAPDSRVPQQTLSVEVERPSSESPPDRATTSGSPS